MDKLSLKEINDALRPYQREARQREVLMEAVRSLSESIGGLEQALERLNRHVAKEWIDVEDVQNPGWKRFWLTLRGEEDAALEKELSEWKVVRNERQHLVEELARLEAERKKRQSELAQIGQIEPLLQELLTLKEQILLRQPAYYQMIQQIRREEKTASMLAHALTTTRLAYEALDKLYDYHLQSRSGATGEQQLDEYLQNCQTQLSDLAGQLQRNKKRLDLRLDFVPQYLASLRKHFAAADSYTSRQEVIACRLKDCRAIITALEVRQKEVAQQLAVAQAKRMQELLA